jgi:hypothetical protein
MLLLTALLACLPQNAEAAASRTRTGTNASAAAEPIAWFTPDQAAACSAAAERGLSWLAERQSAAGCWTGLVGHKMGNDYIELETGMQPAEQRRRGSGHLGVTAICGMAFLASGSLPDRGPHGKVVRAVHDYLCAHALENGFLTDAGTRMYSHAFATLFLAEIHGMAETDAAKRTLERAVDLIVDSQNEYGGWRYNLFDRETDLSVTVCQVQALRAARNIGIRVPPETIERAMAYVNESRVKSGRNKGLYYYKIYGRGGYEKPDEYAINAAALTALSSAGVHDDRLTEPVLDFLTKEYANVADYAGDHYYFWYGNYYAAQAFYQHGGETCRRYFARLSDDLIRSQRVDGSWPNSCGPGPEFATAVACILLQMPKQYLPIFQR